MDYIVMGCYDGSLVGWDVDDEGVQQSFGFAAHIESTFFDAFHSDLHAI